MTTEVLLGVDVGGTTTAAGLVTAAGAVLAETSAATHGGGRGTALLTITELVASVLDRAQRESLRVAGIGVGVPGIVDAASGRIGDEIPNVPELAGQLLAAALGERFRLPAFVDNDVNALAFGEYVFGAGRGARSLVVLAPGTGFGAGIVLDGRLVRGAGGFGGEFGHAPVKFDGRPCWCGGRGCVAVYASGRGIAEAARAQAAVHRQSTLLAVAGGDPAAITAPMVFAAAAAGDPVAAAVIAEACRALGAIIAVIVNGLNPEVIVVTGGVAASYLPLERKVVKAAAEHAFARALAQTRLSIVPGDKRVTMRGAAALVLYETRLEGGRP
ncbi:MAG: ROK family protein [Candidatus Rokubacteria bacterium]|nr:ROK family protein [Candidatus Rokubacteria bacterium]